MELNNWLTEPSFVKALFKRFVRDFPLVAESGKRATSSATSWAVFIF